MGKGHSKHGQCYLVNAHFNPLCQLEDTNSLQSSETPLASQDSGLQLTPEISFTLSEDDKSHSDKNTAKKCALEVFLPEETVSAALNDPVMDIKVDSNSGHDIHSKKEHKVALECIRNESNSGEQEFSFVLRNYAGQERDQEDAEKIVLHSICDALKSTLKIPPSGTHTLKVHLTVSPGCEKTTEANQLPASPEDGTCDRVLNSDTENPLGKQPCHQTPDKTPSSVSTASPVKPSSVYAKYCQQDNLTNPNSSPYRDIYPSPHSRRRRIFTEKKDAKKWMDVAHLGRKENILNSKGTPEHSSSRERHHLHQRTEHQVNSKDCSHYLDLADLRMPCAKESQDAWDLRHLNPAYCSPRHLERGHRLCHYQKQGHGQKKSIASYSRPEEAELHSSILKYKLLQKAKNNLLDLSFDLYDLEEKQAEKSAQQHRRSRSYDTNQYSLVNSPNMKHRSCKCSKCVFHCNDEVPPSPNRHHRHCHKKREKDKLRAMEQVARWLEREELSHEKEQNRASEMSSLSKDGAVERHEYHHIHEHHHYYHYLES